MAIIEVKVPQLSESVAEATLLDWHKKEGEPVKRDENLIDIETDKVVLELPAPADGVLVRIIKKARDSVGSGDVIAQIDTEAKAGAATPAAASTDGSEAAGSSANRPPVAAIVSRLSSSIALGSAGQGVITTPAIGSCAARAASIVSSV